MSRRMCLFRILYCMILLGLGAVEARGLPDQLEQMRRQVAHGEGFLAALDQSGGSTPMALDRYEYPRENYEIGGNSMFDAVHEMRIRIMTSPAFTGERVLGAILFEQTMKREVNGQPVPEYLWKLKQIVPFLKIDKGLMEEENGVQLMKPIPDLDETLRQCKKYGIFGTKMRSVIKNDNQEGIETIVDQQFEIGRRIIAAGLIPIIEPEVAIDSPSKQHCEELLKAALLERLDSLGEEESVMLKVTLPSTPGFYNECIDHPRCLRVVALSGGYSRAEALELLSQQPKMIASFSRALTEGLTYRLSNDEFDLILDAAIGQIYARSKA